MRCAEIDSETGQIINFVVADPEVDSTPAGSFLMPVSPDVTPDYRWNGAEFVLTPEAQARLDAEVALIEQEAWADG